MIRPKPIAVLGLTLALLAVIAPAQESRQLPAVELVGTIDRVHDGDYVRMVVEIPVVVRLRDCWAPELDEPGGVESRDHLQGLALGKQAKLRVEYEPGKGLGQVFSFGRVLGHVTLEEGIDLSAAQVAAGHATKEKPTD